MRGGNEHTLHKVFVLGFVRRNAHSAAVLCLVFGYGKALYIPRMSERYDHIFHWYEVGVLYLAVVDGYLRLSLRRVPLLYVEEVGPYNFKHSALVGEYVFEVGYLRLEL